MLVLVTVTCAPWCCHISTERWIGDARREGEESQRREREREKGVGGGGSSVTACNEGRLAHPHGVAGAHPGPRACTRTHSLTEVFARVLTHTVLLPFL